MGAVENHYIHRSKGLFSGQESDVSYRKLKDEPVRLPTLRSRYTSPYYLDSMKAYKTQVIVKIVSRASGIASVNRLGDYIARDMTVEDSQIMGKAGYEIEDNEYLSLEDEFGNIYENKAERRALIKEWSQHFRGNESYKQQKWKEERLKQMEMERNNLQAKMVAGHASETEKQRYRELRANIANKSYKGDNGKIYDLNIYLPKDTTHMILSIGGMPKNDKELEKATAAVREFLSQNLSEIGHRYVFAAHNDTDNLHYHVIIKNCNEFDHTALRFDKADLFMLRQTFAKELEAVGFERGAELRRDREMTLEKVAKGVELLHQDQTWYQHSLSKGSKSNFDAFSYRSRVINKTNFLLSALSAEDRYTSIFQFEKQERIAKARKEIMHFRKALQTVRPKDLETEKEGLKNKLEKDSSFISSKISKIEGYTRESMQAAIEKKKENNIKSASLFLQSHKERLEIASKEIKDKAYQAFFHQLAQKANLNTKLVKQLTKSKSKDWGIEME